MVTISLCMIVKNEEKNLATCLDCLKGICEEIIIVDTGSTDSTKQIAAGYTDKVFDFAWTGDFSAARNFAFSKATKDYIYSADADEYIDEENRAKLRDLKELILPEIEIVQMVYVEDGIRTVLDDGEELRPKLYKRIREFSWIDPVHETVRTLPVVYDSDIRIEHRPENLHAGRDFSLIERAYDREGKLSHNLYDMYAREVYKWGDRNSLAKASMIFEKVLSQENIDEVLYARLSCVIAKSALESGDYICFSKYTSKVLALHACSEVCCLLGDFFASHDDSEEARLWYYNASSEYKAILDSETMGKYPEEKLESLNFK